MDSYTTILEIFYLKMVSVKLAITDNIGLPAR